MVAVTEHPNRELLNAAILAELNAVLAELKRHTAYIECETYDSESYEDVIAGQSAVKVLEEVADRIDDRIRELSADERLREHHVPRVGG